MTTYMSPTSLHTFGSRQIDFLDPKPEDIDIEDIFMSLSRTSRYRGFTTRIYSVLEHSYRGALAMRKLKPEYTLEFLLHDAAEAYVGDVPTPLKELIPEFRTIEHRIDAVIREKYGLPLTMSPEVKAMDLAMMVTEKQALKPDSGDWGLLEGLKPANVNIDPDTYFSNNWLRSAALDLFAGLIDAV